MAKVGWRRAVVGLGLSLSGALGAGCGGGGGGGGSKECASWMIDMFGDSGATATLESGALVLRRPGPTDAAPVNGPFNGDDLALSQVGLTGTFDVNVDWEGLQTGGGVWSQIEAGIWWNDPQSGNIYQAAGSVGGNGGEVVIINDPQFTIDQTDLPLTPSALDGARGSFHFIRTAAGASSTTTVNGQAVTAQATAPFPDATYTLFIGIGIGPIANDNDLHDEESIRITRVTVTGGGGTVKSDEFACAALP